MKKTVILLSLIVVLIAVAVKLIFFPSKSSLSSPSTNTQEQKINVEPSKTVKAYADPTGFTFSYPDNLSLLPNELKDANTYADIQLTAKGVEGSLHLTISDSKFKSLEEWIKSTDSKEKPQEVQLGNLKAKEIVSTDSSSGASKLMLGALDSGVLFNIEIPLGANKVFWMSVYSSVLKDFAFTTPVEATASQGSSDDISFEGEEVVN